MLDKTNVDSPVTMFLLRDHYDTIDYFDKKVAAVKDVMFSYTVDDLAVKQLLRRPGIGVIAAATMRALIGRFDRFRTGKQLSNFCAIAPKNRSVGGKTTTGGLRIAFRASPPG